ncbi:MAG: UvrD-helicase domain-containing protein [Alistipes sp.]|nr:UvrD-helicase domain-containing protein [Candidatus Minthomonas equi]
MLTISKASAGSGKTHKLTGEYLRLLFNGFYQGKETPYRRILAVTFTNKATAEMKERIVSELDNLFSGKKSPYMEQLIPLTGDDNRTAGEKEDDIRKNAGVLLRSVLNDYSGFNVSTIDSFFQMILRAFAREMGQTSNYNVELDTEEVLVEAVDSLMSSLDETDKEDLLKWLIEMAESEIEQGRGWDISRKLNSLGGFLFNETFRLRVLEGRAMDRVELKTFREELLALKKTFEGEVAHIAEESLSLIRSSGLELSDFAGGSRSAMMKLVTLSKGIMSLTAGFVKMADADSPEGSWFTKTSKNKAQITLLYGSELGKNIRDIVSLFRSEKHSDYITAGLVLKNYSILGVFSDLRAEIGKWCRDNNSVILSETNDFLHKIIDRDETPFIYEKAATRIDHYMLDEFQDTSAMQWDNFRPLVKDSVDNGNDNLIVGDVKQSIYRWRNSDWKLLSSQVPSEFRLENLKMSPLSENWRSGRAIIDFNNEFFSWAGKQVQSIYNSENNQNSTQISSIYSDVEQSLPRERKDVPGHVMVKFVGNGEDKSWKESVLEYLCPKIEDIISRGINPGEIAVLVRTNDEGALVSTYLIEHGYNIVTEDTLKISSSECVGKVVSVLNYILHPDDGMSAWLYEKTGVSVSGTLDMPLYDLCEWTVSSLAESDRTQVAFLQAFMDCVKDYVTKNGSDLSGFLKWWEVYGSKISISAPEGVSSIRVMTVHKSKGLGMKAVIIPFLECKLFRGREIVWCSSDREPFCRAGIIPVHLSGEMLDSAFRQQYLDEKLYENIDSLNLTYVAFTRAVNELHVFAQLPDNPMKQTTVSQLLYRFLQDKGKLESDSYESGVWFEKEEKCPRADSENDLYPVPSSYDVFPGGNRIKVSLRNVEKMSGSMSQRLRCIVMHDIFSNIRTADDIETAVDNAVLKGEISASEREIVLNDVRERLRMAESAGFKWFDAYYKTICEVPVLSPGGYERRPDRVMFRGGEAVVVDYKFGVEHDPSYRKQVAGYTHTLKEMGYEDVKGYIWYNDYIEEVSSTNF